MANRNPAGQPDAAEERVWAIDLVYYGNADSTAYDFIVRPGADPGNVRLAFNHPAKLKEMAICW
jgi:hypothetical protein